MQTETSAPVTSETPVPAAVETPTETAPAKKDKAAPAKKGGAKKGTPAKKDKAAPAKKGGAKKEKDKAAPAKSKGTEAKADKKEKEKRPVGRPLVYDHKKILETLEKYKGQRGGLKRAHADLLKLKAFSNEDGGISYMTVVSISRKAGFSFPMGSPKRKKTEAKTPKTEKAAA